VAGSESVITYTDPGDSNVPSHQSTFGNVPHIHLEYKNTRNMIGSTVAIFLEAKH
jgi:hypothetical protein